MHKLGSSAPKAILTKIPCNLSRGNIKISTLNMLIVGEGYKQVHMLTRPIVVDDSRLVHDT